MINNINNKYFLNKGIYDNKDIFENTIEAIKATIKVKLGIYLTVRETKDHIFVIYEDSNLSRLQNIKDKIGDMTYEDLEYISFYHIPKLSEVIELINGKIDIIFDLKIKTKNKEIYEMLKNYKGKYLVLGSAKIINEINKNYPFITVGEIITKKIKFSIYNYFIKSDFRSYDIALFDSIKFKKLKEDGKLIIGYKITNQDLYNEFKDEFDYLVIDNYQNIKLDKAKI